MMEPDTVNQSHRQHIAHKRAASITDEWQWDTGNREQLDRHPNILEDVEGDHADDTRADVGIEWIIRIQSSFCQMVD